MTNRRTKVELTIQQEEMLRKIGDRIKQLRVQNGHSSSEDFAYEFDLNRTQIGRYERGEDLRVSTLIKIIIALKVSPSEFFEDFTL